MLFNQYKIFNIAAGLLNFQKSDDLDGFVGDFSSKTKVKTEMYQIKIKTDPGGGLYEGSVTHNLNNNLFSMKVSANILLSQIIYFFKS